MTQPEPRPPVEELLRDLGDPDRFVRMRAAKELGEIGDPRAVEPLLATLRDRAGDVRAKAACALGRLRDERALGALVGLLNDPKPAVRSAAVAAVKKFGKKATRPLLDALATADGDRTALVAALSAFRSPEVFAALVAANRFAPEAVLEAVAKFKTPAATEFLIAALDSPVRPLRGQAARHLGRRKARAAVEVLLEKLAQARTLFERLARHRETYDGEPVSESSREDFAAAAEAAPTLHATVAALGEIGDPRAFEPLRELLEFDEGHDMLGLVPEFVVALRKIDNPRAVDLLHGLLDDPGFPGRERLRMRLAGIDLMGAVRSLTVRVGGGELADLGTLRVGLEGAMAALLRFAAQADTAGPQDEAELGREGTEQLRQLEDFLRGIGRKPPEE